MKLNFGSSFVAGVGDGSGVGSTVGAGAGSGLRACLPDCAAIPNAQIASIVTAVLTLKVPEMCRRRRIDS
jgi:hypothetical protein